MFLKTRGTATTFRDIIFTLGAFPMSDIKHLNEQDKEYLLTYVYDLWMIMPMLRPSHKGPVAMAERGICHSVADVVRLWIAYLEGKSSASIHGHPKVDAETVPLLSSFVRLHRLGIPTFNSQPEVLDEPLLSRQDTFFFLVPPPVGDGKVYVGRQDGYVTGYMTETQMKHALRFVERHPSRRLSGIFRFTNIGIEPPLPNRIVGLLAKHPPGTYRRKRYSPLAPDGTPKGPWIADNPEGWPVDKHGFALRHSREFHPLEDLHPHVETDWFSDEVGRKLKSTYCWMYDITAHADSAGSIDLPDDLARFFSSIVPAEERIIGDAPTLFGSILKAHDQLKADGVMQTERLAARKEDYVRKATQNMHEEMHDKLPTIISMAEEEYQEMLIEKGDEDAENPDKLKTPEAKTFIDRYVSGMKRTFEADHEKEVLMREW